MLTSELTGNMVHIASGEMWISQFSHEIGIKRFATMFYVKNVGLFVGRNFTTHILEDISNEKIFTSVYFPCDRKYSERNDDQKIAKIEISTMEPGEWEGILRMMNTENRTKILNEGFFFPVNVESKFLTLAEDCLHIEIRGIVDSLSNVRKVHQAKKVQERTNWEQKLAMLMSRLDNFDGVQIIRRSTDGEHFHPENIVTINTFMEVIRYL